jgi:hypothetical protein
MHVLRATTKRYTFLSDSQYLLHLAHMKRKNSNHFFVSTHFYPKLNEEERKYKKENEPNRSVLQNL